ncbi:MAG: hypothetical protein LKF71_06665 [Oscillospiraceae bacterium]|nr:hypothetical protein [Oscillospiraceae bacterium]
MTLAWFHATIVANQVHPWQMYAIFHIACLSFGTERIFGFQRLSCAFLLNEAANVWNGGIFSFHGRKSAAFLCCWNGFLAKQLWALSFVFCPDFLCAVFLPDQGSAENLHRIFAVSVDIQ